VNTHSRTHTHTNMYVKISRLCLAGVWEWHTGGGHREPRARSGVRYPLARSASERDASDGRRSHGDTVSHPQFNNFPVQVPGFASRDTHVARSHRYTNTLHCQQSPAEKGALSSEEKSLFLVSGYFPLRPFVSIFTRMSRLWPTEPISLPLPPRKSN